MNYSTTFKAISEIEPKETIHKLSRVDNGESFYFHRSKYEFLTMVMTFNSLIIKEKSKCIKNISVPLSYHNIYEYVLIRKDTIRNHNM